MLEYIGNLCAADQDPDVRDRASLIHHILDLNPGQPPVMDEEAVESLWQSSSKRRETIEKAALAEREKVAQDEKYVMGSMSHIVGHTVLGYLPMSSFQEQSSSAALRDKATYEQAATQPAGSDSDSGSSSGSSSGSDSDSDSDSESGSDSDSDSSSSSSGSGADESSRPAVVQEADLLFGSQDAAKPSDNTADLFDDVFGTSGAQNSPSTSTAQSLNALDTQDGAEPTASPTQQTSTADAPKVDAGDDDSGSASSSGGSDSDSDSGSDSSSGGSDSSSSGDSSDSDSGSEDDGNDDPSEQVQANNAAKSDKKSSDDGANAITDAFSSLDFA